MEGRCLRGTCGCWLHSLWLRLAGLSRIPGQVMLCSCLLGKQDVSSAVPCKPLTRTLRRLS